MRLFYTIIKYAASKIKIPELAVRMFKVSNDISEIDKKNIPTELIPLNTIQLSRGLLNFTVIQSIKNWILPYWVVKQYDPSNTSFIPRSHTGVSINITNRNWTGAGNMDCDNEPIVDPAGLIMPFRNCWSIDFWLQADEEIFYPSYGANVKQRLINDLPVIENSYNFLGLELVQTVYSKGSILQAEVSIVKAGNIKTRDRLIMSVRPFNPEGVALIEDIVFISDDNCFHIDNKKIYFNTEPDYVYCSNYQDGDAVRVLSKGKETNNFSSHCCKGLASSIAVFELTEEESIFYFNVPLSEDNTLSNLKETVAFLPGENMSSAFTKENALSNWESLLKEGSQFSVPDNEITSVIRTSLTTLLMLIDKNSITPGPFTYHHFWFRDAAFMISALDNFNYSHYTKEIINNFPAHQDKKGYFRSQKGEWDSNGQVIWTIYKHYLLTKDTGLLIHLFPSMLEGIRWIDNYRLKNPEEKWAHLQGLMPKGLSAEHLGLADYYYWDNFWSLAGVGCFIEICKILNYNQQEKYTQELYNNYLSVIISSINAVKQKYNAGYIPAAAERDADYGMIGSIIPLYPLQINAIEANKTLDYIYDNFLIQGMFYQNFIHSGLNPYLTIQLAHCYLFAGDRNKFNQLFRDTLNKRTPVNNFPEAIHPLTGGGCMGDGHHGWAAAEIVSAFRDSFLWENTNDKEFKIFSGIPREWFTNEFMMKSIPTSAGLMDLEYKRIDTKMSIIIRTALRNISSIKARITLPFIISVIEEIDQHVLVNRYGETEISFNITSHKTIIEAEILKEYPISVKPGNV